VKLFKWNPEQFVLNMDCKLVFMVIGWRGMSFSGGLGEQEGPTVYDI